MKKPDTPEDEQARLVTLRSLGLLATAPEERFDRLTRMAKRLFGVPIALVSLVDESHQWFKSRVGLNASELPRSTSFCGHAILGDDVFVVTNAIEDKRFADNPFVLNDPHIRFYAGCPLKAPNGHKVGTLCVIDREARIFEKEDIEALKDLASMAERELTAVQLATLDELTNISNRRGFSMLAHHSLQLCRRQHTSAVLVFMDLDNFKSINDSFGHAEGDRALTVFAEQMHATCRSADIFARLGGDEFAILLINATKERVEDIVARFRQTLDEYNQNAQRGYSISFSHGTVEFDPERHGNFDAMLAEGDALMYQLKRSKTTRQQ